MTSYIKSVMYILVFGLFLLAMTSGHAFADATVSLNAGANGTIDVQDEDTGNQSDSCTATDDTNSCSFDNNDDLTVTITPESVCYEIASKSYNGDNGSSYTENPNGSATQTVSNVSNGSTHSFAATFQLRSMVVDYSIIPSGSANITVTPSDAVTVDDVNHAATLTSCEDITFSVTPSENYSIDDVTFDGSSIGSSGSYTLSPFDIIGATNAQLAISMTSIATDDCNITTSANPSAGGTITPTSATLAVGESEDFDFGTSTDYEISDVTVDGVSKGAVTSYTHSCASGEDFAIEVTYNYTGTGFTVMPSVQNSTGGAISPDSDQTVPANGSVDFTMSPEAGYILSDILVGPTGGTLSSTTDTVQSPFTLSNISENMEIQAVFSADATTYTITPEYNSTQGEIVPSTAQTIKINDTPMFTINPASKAYAIEKVLICPPSYTDDTECNNLGTVSSYMFNPVNANYIIKATFISQPTYSVTSSLSPSDAGSISPSTPFTAAENEEPTFSISSDPGYTISAITVGSTDITVSSGATNKVITLDPVTANVAISVTFAESTTDDCITIDDQPVETQIKGAPANIMFIIDDADSMDNEVSTLEAGSEGTEFDGVEYLYGIEGDYVSSCGNDDCSDNTKALNAADCLGEGGPSDPGRGAWKALWYEYNKVYYNPTITYTPWPTAAGGTMSEADPDLPYSHPIDQGFQLNLDNTYFTVAHQDSAGADAGNLSIPVSHYYIKNSGNIYLVIIRGPHGSCAYEYYQIIGADASTTPLSSGDPQTLGDSGITVREVASGSVPAGIKFWTDPDKERQNFANWFQYYRRRQLMAINAIAKTIFNLSNVNMGFTATEPAVDSSFSNISTNPADYLNLGLKDSSGHGLFIQPILPVNTYKTELINRLYDYRAGTTSSSNFVRRALEEVGKYFDNASDTDTNFGPSPITEKCQQNFVVVFCDGAYSGGAPNNGTGWDDLTSSSDAAVHVSITDANNNTIMLTGQAPYSDGSTKTMADMAMWSYIKDLATNLDDEVPTNDVDKADWQHLVAYTITYGDKGLHDPAAVPTSGGGTAPFDLDDSTTWPAAAASNSCTPWCWPGNVTSATDPEKIDDIWHSAVNGRGEFFAADNPQKLEEALASLIASIQERIGASGSAVSVSSNELLSGTFVFQSKYNTKGWAGDVHAKTFTDAGAIDSSNIWEADAHLEAMVTCTTNSDGDVTADCNTSAREIATYNSGGAAFTAANTGLTSDLVSYLKGNKFKEERFGGSYRNRVTNDDETFLLGDIVHSSPVFHKNVDYASFSSGKGSVFYVGANDGMLHAFIVEKGDYGGTWEGKELFAYVPSFVVDHLSEYASLGYSHKYFVDLTPTIADVSATQTLLVGGLGKGGKGYYCLDVSDPASNTAANASTWVEWEYPTGTDDDMGYSFSKAWIVKSHMGETTYGDRTGDYVVVFGNGYASANESAVLYILNTDGTTVTVDGSASGKIDTGVTGCNGLSTPAPVDIDEDGVMDYIYAGDLKGNLWKFDVSSTDATDWRIAYNTAYDFSGTKKPLFESGRPITTMPDALSHCSEGFGSIVIFGTGKMLSINDLDLGGATESVYGIWDVGEEEDPTEYLGSFDRTTKVLSNLGSDSYVELLENTATNYVVTDSNGDSADVRVIDGPDDPNWATQSDDVADPDGYGSNNFNSVKGAYNPNPIGVSGTPANAGWYFDLIDTNERVTLDIQIRSGVAYVVTTVPNLGGDCDAYSGYSWVNGINACTGGLPENSVWDISNSDGVDESDFITITETTETVDGVEVTTKTATLSGDGTGITVPGIKTASTVTGLTLAGDKALLSLETGDIDELETLYFGAGFLYWRIIE